MTRNTKRPWKYFTEFAKREGQRLVAKSLRARNQEFIIRSKSKPCMDCGVQYNHWQMQFDHREPQNKLFDISEVGKAYSLKRVSEEIAKCDVVCANCHLDRTYRYKHWLVNRQKDLKFKRENPQLSFPETQDPLR